MMNKIFGLLLLSVFFVACGSDDDGDPVKPQEKQIVHSFKQELKGFKNQAQGLDAVVTIDQVLPAENKGLINASFQSSGNFLKVSGFSQSQPTLELRNFVVTVGTKQFSLGTCKVGGIQSQNEFAPDVEYSGNTEVAIAQAIVDALKTKDRKANIKVSFTSNDDFSKGVELQINFAALYSYYVLAN